MKPTDSLCPWPAIARLIAALSLPAAVADTGRSAARDELPLFLRLRLGADEVFALPVLRHDGPHLCWTGGGQGPRSVQAERAQWPGSSNHRDSPPDRAESAAPDRMPPRPRMLIPPLAGSFCVLPLGLCQEKDRGALAPAASANWWRAIREEVDRPPVPAEELGGCCRECEEKAPRRRVTIDALGKWPVPVLRLSAGAANWSNPFARGITAPQRVPPPARR